MAVTKAKAKFVRVSPRKVRQVIDLIKGKDVSIAENMLSNLNKKSAYLINKVLKSAVANAENNRSLKKEDLYISKAYADQGPVLKRYRAASMGRAVMVRRRTAHIIIELDLKTSATLKVARSKGGKK